MKIFNLILVAIIMVSCSSDDDDDQNHFNLSNGIEFSVKSSAGQDLLNPENPNHLMVDEIKLYYLENNEPIEIFEANLDSPRHYLIYENTISGDYRIAIGPHISPQSEKNSITLIEWEQNDIDTLKTEHSFSKNSIILRKVWLNDELIWNKENGDPAYYELIK